MATLVRQSGRSLLELVVAERLSGTARGSAISLAVIRNTLEWAGIEFLEGNDQPPARIRSMQRGERVRLLEGTPIWVAQPADRRNQLGDIAEVIDGGGAGRRITIRYPDGYEIPGVNDDMVTRSGRTSAPVGAPAIVRSADGV
jgi:hypothetical protein